MKKILLNLLLLYSTGLIMLHPLEAETAAVTLTEYYDYECPHCRAMEPVIQQLQKDYPRLNIEQRVTPLLNDNSRFIASFALASSNQGQSDTVHQLLMQSIHPPTVETAVGIVKRLQLNPQKLTQDMRSRTVIDAMAANAEEAKQYSLQGNMYLPILVFTQNIHEAQPIVLRGEQSYRLLSAIVQQLSESYVQQTQKTATA